MTGRRWQAERLRYNDQSGASNPFQRLMNTGFSDRVRDAPIEKRFLRERASISFAGRLRVASGRAGNACCGIEPERFTVPNPRYLFAADTRGTKRITASRVE